MIERISVGLIGATGTVGRQLAQLLLGHPWFELAEVGASPDSAGRSLAEAAPEQAHLPAEVRDLTLKAPDEEWASPLLLSALPSDVAGPVEAELAGRGHLVVSNAASHRMDADVPLVIPEVNPDHLALVDRQAERWPGILVTNPNCSAVGLALALAPLERAFGVRTVMVTTLQSLSGAGRSGPETNEMLENVIPYIGGEEEKLAREPLKILGQLTEGEVRPADFTVSAQVHRVPVPHGHMLAVSVKLGRPAMPRKVVEVLTRFTGAVIDEKLPSAPARPIELLEGEARPQPRLDRDRAGGMAISVGRVRPCEVLDVKFSVLVHNLIRGAAGAALLNAELCHACGISARARAG